MDMEKQAAQDPISSWNFLPEAFPEVSFQDNTFPNKADFVSKLSSGEINSSKKKMSKQEQNLKNFIKKNPKRAALTSGLGLPTLNHPRNSPGSSGDSACGTHRQLVLPIRDGAALPRNPWIRACPILAPARAGESRC